MVVSHDDEDQLLGGDPVKRALEGESGEHR
jgi:hypothetical protein